MCGLYSCQHWPSLPSSPSLLPLLFLQVVYLISILSCCLLLWFSKMMCLDLFISRFQNLLHFLPPSLPASLLEKKKPIPTRKMKNFPSSVENLASLIPVKTVVSLIGNGLLSTWILVWFVFYPGEILINLCLTLGRNGQTPWRLNWLFSLPEQRISLFPIRASGLPTDSSWDKRFLEMMSNSQ